MTTSRRMLVGRGEGVNGALVEEEGTKVGGRIMPPSTGSVGAGFRDGAPARETRLCDPIPTPASFARARSRSSCHLSLSRWLDADILP